MSTYTVHGGHAAQGNAYSGAVGLINESREDRIDMALSLKELDPKTVPINILNRLILELHKQMC